MKIFTAGFLTESSDLAPLPTSTVDWKVERYNDNGSAPSLFAEVLTLFRSLSDAKGWQVSESICATAFPPGGRIVRDAYESLRSTILDDLQRAMPVDGVLLHLHGASTAYGYDDCEGDLLENIRGIVGPDVAIGALLDPHCHMTKKMMSQATAMILYKTWSHLDMKDRATELFELVASNLEGKVKPCMALFDCRMIDFFDEAIEPMKSFLKKVYVKEGETGILSISPVHGFPLADVADMGSKMLVITDDDPVLAREVAEQLGMEFYETRGQISQCSDIEAALDEAQERAGRGERAVKLLEFGDLPGCGFSTDGTELLQAMIRRGMTNVAAGLIWDPQAVHICHEVGPGADLLMRIGGKASVFSGTPLDLNISVIRTYRDFVCATWIGDIALGDVAVVRSGDIELLLVSRRVLCGGMQVFRELGVEPSDKQYLVFKYIHDSDPIVAYGSTLDYKQWPFTQITRPKWPWDENPFEST